MDFSNIDTTRNGMASLMDALKKKTSFVKQDFSKDDEWTISKDKSGNGAAVIRFIPSKDGELFQEVKSHGYKNPQSNKWFIENCPKTMDWDNLCPACEHAQALLGGRDYKSLTKDEQAKIKPFFTNTSYWSTILVEKDDANPENEGKIFKFRYGKKILEKILGRAGDDPLDDAIKGVNVFDPKDGASFKLVVKRVEGFPNYDTSSFKAPEALLGGNQKKIDALVQTGQEIGYMRTDKNFKEYSDLKKRFYSILGKEIPAQEEEVLDKPVTEESYDKPEVPDVSYDSGSDDEDLDYFKELSSSNV